VSKPSSGTSAPAVDERKPSAASRALNGASKPEPAEKPAVKAPEPVKPAEVKKAEPAAKNEPVKPAEAKKPAAADSAGAPHTLTAADYARTTASSPSATAVIPAVKSTPRPKPAAAPAAPAPAGRRASLHLTRVEPWSVTKIAFAISVALMIVGVVAVTIFWFVLDIIGVWDQINDSVTSVLSDDGTGFDITDYLGFTRLVGLTLIISAINVVLFTALATIGAYLYNLAAQLLGGAEVTFAEEN